MSNRLHIQGEYPPDWPEIGNRICAEAGHRCIRCGHPYTKGAHGKGEWSPCDGGCQHGGPLGTLYNQVYSPIGADWTARRALDAYAGCEVVCAQWRILTVHHFDGDKSNCAWHNLLALCQRCHLIIQGRVNPNQPYMLEHSEWLKPYVAGFYAIKYLNQNLTREQVMSRLDELLKLERIA